MKYMQRIHFFALLLSSIFVGLGNAQADTLIKFDAIETNQSGSIAIKDGLVLLRDPRRPGRLVMDTNTSTLYMIDDTRKQYVKMNEGTLEKTASMMSLMQQVMLSQIQKLPPEERKAFEQRLGLNAQKKAPPKIEVHRTGAHKKLRGIDCEVTNILTDGKLTAGACVATPKAAGVPEKDYQTMKKMFAISRRMAEKTSSLSRGMPGNFSPQMVPELNGVPIEAKDFLRKNSLEIKSIQQTTLNAKDFQPGADYTLFDPVEQMQLQMKMQNIPNTTK